MASRFPIVVGVHGVPVQQMKANQVEQCKQVVATFREVGVDHYCVPVMDVSRNHLFDIEVRLSPEFPVVPPNLSVSQPMRHPVVDGEGRIYGLSRLQRWREGPDLGAVVNEAVKELTVRQLPEMGAWAGLGGGVWGSPALGAGSPTQKEDELVTMPALSSEERAPELEALSEEELFGLKDNESIVFDDWLRGQIEWTDRDAKVHALAERNRATAQATLGLREELATAVEACEKAYEGLKGVEAEVDELRKQEATVLEQANPMTLALRMRSLAAESKKATQEAQRAFLEGTETAGTQATAVELASFKKSFLEKRREYHRWLTKAEKEQNR